MGNGMKYWDEDVAEMTYLAGYPWKEDYRLAFSALRGDLDLTLRYLETSELKYLAMNGSIVGGHLRNIEYLLSTGNFEDFSMYAMTAVEKGQKEIARYFAEKFNMVNQCIGYATNARNREMIEVFLEMGPDDISWGLCIAAQNDDREMVDYFLEKGADDFDGAMLYATLAGKKSMVRYLRSRALGET